jgi:serine/threonine protein phosphatase PrpC
MITSGKVEGILGYAELPGRRRYMEVYLLFLIIYFSIVISSPPDLKTPSFIKDTTQVASLPDLTNHFLLFVADGHGGRGVSENIKETFLEILLSNPFYQMYKDMSAAIEGEEDSHGSHCTLLENALKSTIYGIEEKLLSMRDEYHVCGSTLVACLLTPFYIVCANVGDSRAIVITIDEDLGFHSTVELSIDHKPVLAEEESRITKAGGFVGAGRVDGELAVSRALGDFKFKQDESLSADEQKVVCSPDIQVYKREKEKEFLLILASDGLWDVFSNDALADFMVSTIEENLCPEKLCEETVMAAYTKGSTDNISCCIAFLFT